MASYLSFEEQLINDTNKKLNKEKILTDLQNKTLPDCNQFFDLILKNITDRRESIKNQYKIKFKEFLNLTQLILSLNIQPHLIETGTIFIIYTFYELILIDRHDKVTELTLNRLEQVFDRSQLNNKITRQLFELCNYLFNSIDEEKIHYFFQDNLIRKSKADKNSFIDYKPPSRNNDDPFCKITNLLNFNMQTIETIPDNQLIDELNDESDLNNQSIDGKTVEWLEDELKKLLKDLPDLCFSADELVNIIFERFQDPKYSDSVFQNDLLNLLGLNQIELIGEIIQNRKSILKSIRERINGVNSSSSNNNNSIKPKQQKTKSIFLKEPKTPSFTQTVTIQTEQELKEQKLINKFEKKMYQERKRLKDKYSNNEPTSSSSNNLQSNYESILMNDNSEFSFYLKRLENERVPKENIPYVFDIYSDIKQTTSFLSNQKLLLPEGTEMNDFKSYKEIIVPPPEPPKKELLENFPLILIDKLDKLTQKIFFGFKTLNQIQSVVFEAATKTNENLLIAAPTGAGKTNVALLTMIHEIKKNICPDTGKINKDNFKIIYITPMRALATEMTDNFTKRLTKSVGLIVKELTGDNQLTHEEIKKTQVLVVTPEKLDILTRKTRENSHLIEQIKLLIFDEIHLLQTDRGSVVESLVGRVVRHVESAQKMIRLVGLSATLPNYLDIAEFLRVNTKQGLFFFDSRFRPVPLIQTFIGCKSVNKIQVQKDMDEICFDKVVKQVQKGNQCMIFVHTRHGTFKTATYLKDEVVKSGLINLFSTQVDIYQKKMIENARNKQLKDLIFLGFGIHHAGLLRHDRNLVEKMFKEGVIKVLVTTSTLAWGINMPVHAVIIKGTEMYDPQKGGFVDLDFLDVIQIFGRAGRPQFDTLGDATIITTHDKLKHYLSILTNQLPIESQFLKNLTDNLNAEIVSGSVTTIDEAVDWLSYTYLYVRMQKNGRNYGVTAATLQNDPDLYHKRIEYIKSSVQKLDQAKMIRYDPVSNTLDPTDLGRIASHYYIKCETIEVFNQYLNDSLLEDDLLKTICLSTEFSQLKSREEEIDELIDIKRQNCMLKVALTPDHVESKVNILVQAFLSRARINSFSLISDTFFIQQNIKRICRGLFEYSIRKGMPLLSRKLLTFSKMFELEQWG